MSGALLDDARRVVQFLRFLPEVRRFTRESLDVPRAEATVRERLARRGELFLEKLRTGVFGNPRSAYLPLLRAAVSTYGETEPMRARHGLEATREELRAREVYGSYEEFKAINAGGRAWPERFPPGVTFDNPLASAGFAARSGGTRSPGSRVTIDFAAIREVAIHRLLRMEAFGVTGALHASYFPILPATTGVSHLLLNNYLRVRHERWFAPLDPAAAPRVYRAQTAMILAVLRAGGGRALRPEYVALNDPAPIAQWISDCTRRGERVAMIGYASALLRVADTARAAGLDIKGTCFYCVGEPVTAAKAEAFARAGGVPVVSYAMSEAGQIANSCPHSAGPDDLHFFTDSFALIRHARRLPYRDGEVRPFLITSLLPGTPKVFLNVETDDCGDVDDRPCPCIWGRLGLTLRISNVRSFAKLTAEGMTLLGTDLVETIERALPERFGGGAPDWQLVEEEEGGRTWLTLRVHPRLGEVDEAAALALLREKIAGGGRVSAFMGDLWREAGSLRWARREPHVTPAGKVFPFQSLR